jgi:DNA invertase Pin-like site-specific DNA recombinase
MKTINHGDTVLINRLDRLARSTLDLLNIVDTISKAGSQFKSLADAWCDTTTPHGRLLLVVLSGLAAFERDLIMARTQAGIKRARELGVQFGRPPRLKPRQRRMIAERYAAGESQAELAKDFKVSEPTIWRVLNPEGKAKRNISIQHSS